MKTSNLAESITVSVLRFRGPEINSRESDYAKRTIEDYGTIIVPQGEQAPGGEHNVLLGIVEVPADADVTGRSRIEMVRPHGSTRDFPGIPNDSTGRDGIRHFLSADRLLDIAISPQHRELGIKLIRDDRPREQEVTLAEPAR